MATYTKIEAISIFGPEVIEELSRMERNRTKDLIGGRGYGFCEEYYTEYIEVNGGRIRGFFFCSKTGAPAREYVEFKRN